MIRRDVGTVPTLLLGLVGALGGATVARAAPPPAEGLAFFEAKIRPVLVEHCYACHSAAGKQKGSLSLDTKADLLAGGESGPAVVPGKSKESLLVQALKHQDHKMPPPPKDKLPDAVVADFVKWVEMGAPDPRDGKSTAKGIDVAAGRSFWAFQPPRKVEPPPVKDATRARTPIDRFILARLEAENLRPVKPAGKRELIRRATFDLIGLPPTPEEVEAFVTDPSPDAFAKVIERLLASPHYGERWGRYWLDVARYAEDQAHTFGVKPNTNGYRYRDWVIAAFNADLPYDRFVKYQIAADLMPLDAAERVRHLPALGFFGLGAQYYKNSDAAKAAADELDDRVDTLTRGFLGLTVSCARCHDHKFDPIPTQDYYSLAGVFQSCRLADVPLASKAEGERFQQGQRRIKDAEDGLKAFFRTEKIRLGESKAGAIAQYVAAARVVQIRRLENPKFAAAVQAKQDGLQPALLERWVKFLDNPSKAGKGVAALDACRQLPPPRKEDKPEPADPRVLRVARDLQQQVESALAERAKGTLPKSKADLLQALFGDKGPFGMTDDECRAMLPTEDKPKLARVQAELDRARKEAPPSLPIAHALSEANPTDMKVFVRGNPAKLGDLAPRRFLRVLAGDEPAKFAHGSGRLDLAEAIAAPTNPLTARVMVNRIWQHHFGRGLVNTPSNFGQLGERPTHPELLDYLATRFVAGGWSMKALHREIMLSATYQLGTDRDEHNLTVDADNRFLWRANRHRLEVEAWRDAMLAVSGKLDRTLGGPSTDLSSASNRRRTVYGKVSRHDLTPLLRLFDFPDANLTSDKRSETTVPQQQLFVLNSPFVGEQAKVLAERVRAEAPGDDASRVRRAFLLAYGRPPSDAEQQLATRFLAAGDPEAEKGRIKLTRWERFAQVLLGSNEFMYLD